MVRYAKGWVKYETENPRYKTEGGAYESMGSMLRRTNRADRIDDYNPEPTSAYLVDAFWDAKYGDVDAPVRPEDLRDALLDRNERAIIMKMDRAFRTALAKQRGENEKYLASKRK